MVRHTLPIIGSGDANASYQSNAQSICAQVRLIVYQALPIAPAPMQRISGV